jgi:hypothetical protein
MKRFGLGIIVELLLSAPLVSIVVTKPVGRKSSAN